MSAESWKRQFYKKSATACQTREALGHSYRKWLGMRPSALRRHRIKVDKDGQLIDDKGCFVLDPASCALCKHYSCNHTCPIDNCNKQWSRWLSSKDPEPMIKLLENAINERKSRKPVKKTLIYIINKLDPTNIVVTTDPNDLAIFLGKRAADFLICIEGEVCFSPDPDVGKAIDQMKKLIAHRDKD